MRGCRTCLPLLLSLALVAVGAPAWGAPTVTVPEALAPVFEALVAGYDGEAPTAVAADGDLVLATGTVAWDDLRSVAVVPDALLTLATDDADALAFQRYAIAPAGQQALIDAGLLPASVTVVDQTGKTVVVPQPVARLASPYGVATYLAYGLGAGERIVLAGFLGARDPAGAAAMERIDPRFPELASVAAEDATSVEYLATLAPDLVFAAARSEWTPSVEAVGMPVVAFDGESPEKLREAMRLTGALLGPDAASRAEAWITYYDDVRARVAAAVTGDAPTSVLFTGTQRTRVASGAMYQTALIEAAGGRSVTADLSGYWNDVGVEQVLVWDPQWILVPPYGGASVAAVLEDPEWGLLDAVRAERVARLPKLVAPWDTPVPDSVLAVVWLAELLYPEAQGLSCADEVAFFYPRFYGYAIGADEVAELCGR